MSEPAVKMASIESVVIKPAVAVKCRATGVCGWAGVSVVVHAATAESSSATMGWATVESTASTAVESTAPTAMLSGVNRHRGKHQRSNK